MKLSRIAAVVTATALTLSSATVFAQPAQPGRDDRQQPPRAQTGAKQPASKPQQTARQPQSRPAAKQPQQQVQHQRPRASGPQFQKPAPAVQRHQFRKGDRLPQQYRGTTYVVNDWSRHRLPPPPRGQQWVQVNGSDYILVAIATGVIMQVLLANSF